MNVCWGACDLINMFVMMVLTNLKSAHFWPFLGVVRGVQKRSKNGHFWGFAKNYDRAHMDRFLAKTPILTFDDEVVVRIENDPKNAVFDDFWPLFRNPQKWPFFDPFLRCSKNTFFRASTHVNNKIFFILCTPRGLVLEGRPKKVRGGGPSKSRAKSLRSYL